METNDGLSLVADQAHVGALAVRVIEPVCAYGQMLACVGERVNVHAVSLPPILIEAGPFAADVSTVTKPFGAPDATTVMVQCPPGSRYAGQSVVAVRAADAVTPWKASFAAPALPTVIVCVP